MKVNKNPANQNIKVSNSKDTLGKLKPGDTIRATVVDKSSNELTLKLYDGTKFTATTVKAFEGQVGDFVQFNVNDISNDKIILDTMPKVGKGLLSSDGQFAKLLASIGLLPDEKNLDILYALGAVNPTDGIRIEEEDGWCLIRASGTEPRIRFTAEGKDIGIAKNLLTKGEEMVRIIRKEVSR